MLLVFTYFLVVCTDVFNVGESGSQAKHDFHISRCEVNYDTKSGDIQIAAHIFIDDLEDGLAHMGKKNLYLCTDKESASGEEAIHQYINQKLVIKIDNITRPSELLGKEVSKDKMAVWCYLEIKGHKNLHSLQMDNKLLLEIFSDQKNIIDFTVDKKKKHFVILDIKNHSEVFTL
ncbi:MAG: DUF6702 family protein [Saprospiraceae bacterium]